MVCAASASIESPSLDILASRLQVDGGDGGDGNPSVTPADNEEPGDKADDGGHGGDPDDAGDGGDTDDAGGSGNGVNAGDGDGGDGGGKASNETTNIPGGGDTEHIDACAKAGTSCKACSDAAKKFVDDEYTCAYQVDQGGTYDSLLCRKMKKSDVADHERDMCSGTNREDKKTAAPTEPTSNIDSPPQPKEETGGIGVGALFLIVGLVVVGGGLYVAKIQMGAKGPPGSATVKYGKYEIV
jgi:hypothetical protein